MQSQQVELIISYQHKHNNSQHPAIKSILGIRIPFIFIILIPQITTECCCLTKQPDCDDNGVA